ncbi:unnamed protein product [Boreogadus saida]
MTSNLQTGGSGVGEATDQRPFSGPLESEPIRARGPFSGPQCASCPASLALGDGHTCFRCLGTEHTAAAMGAPASCAACRALPEEGHLSRHLFFSPSVDLSEAIDIFRAGVPDIEDVDDDHIEVDDIASLDDVFVDFASGFSNSRASTKATVVPKEKPRQMADLFGEIMGEAAAPSTQDHFLAVAA